MQKRKQMQQVQHKIKGKKYKKHGKQTHIPWTKSYIKKCNKKRNINIKTGKQQKFKTKNKYM